MTKIIDTHAHYDDEAFDGDRDELIRGLFSTSVKGIVTVGCSMNRWRPTLELIEKYPNIYGALGVHPEDVDNLSDDYIERLRELAKNPKIVAIGEAGLDYHYENFDKKRQAEVFEAQIALAKELSKPLIIHSRESAEDSLEIISRTKPPKAVMHCFSGSAQMAEELVKKGLYISFTGVLTFNNAKKAVSACEAVPEDRLMLETDCPYMAPVPFRGKRCDSSMIYETAAKMAEIKRKTTEEMLKICAENAGRFFGVEAWKSE